MRSEYTFRRLSLNGKQAVHKKKNNPNPDRFHTSSYSLAPLSSGVVERNIATTVPTLGMPDLQSFRVMTFFKIGDARTVLTTCGQLSDHT
jgi:hypothetical protein